MYSNIIFKYFSENIFPHSKCNNLEQFSPSLNNILYVRKEGRRSHIISDDVYAKNIYIAVIKYSIKAMQRVKVNFAQGFRAFGPWLTPCFWACQESEHLMMGVSCTGQLFTQGRQKAGSSKLKNTHFQ